MSKKSSGVAKVYCTDVTGVSAIDYAFISGAGAWSDLKFKDFDSMADASGKARAQS